MEDLRRQLSSQADELEKARVDRERNDNVITRTVAALEADLTRVRKEAEVFGRDLQKLRREKDRTEDELRTAKVEAEEGERRAKNELDIVSQKLVRYKEDARKLRQDIQDHVCAGCVLTTSQWWQEAQSYFQKRRPSSRTQSTTQEGVQGVGRPDTISQG
jgi:chromosome segregation ATPase